MNNNFRKTKKEIFTLFFFDKFRNKPLIIINFCKPIRYSHYFSLCNILHGTLIKFQLAKYLSVKSYNTLFIKHDLPRFNSFDNVVLNYNCSFEKLKKILLDLKKTLDKEYNAHKDYYLNDTTLVLNHIEECTKVDADYIRSSLRQLKSIYNRRLREITKKFNTCKQIANTSQAIDYIYQELAKKLECQEVLNTTDISLEMLLDEQTK
jgi:hypothetical protein